MASKFYYASFSTFYRNGEMFNYATLLKLSSSILIIINYIHLVF